ncbi:hypothetical protein M405DRAFT_870081 [Rhizopogon salebrosus TDB-379]|nr:hypothetical protein M405DRAFT_870081 [Rhizopogon salebrosus TDB-379]
MYRVQHLFYTAPDELIPVYGTRLDRTITSAISLERYNDFYLNAFSDKEWYHTLHADYV